MKMMEEETKQEAVFNEVCDFFENNPVMMREDFQQLCDDFDIATSETKF